ncbi:defensin-like [Paramacrobiotus metropolitanus]|uniref:defensin-like n=1 Tax=Paramacrobiotus metropolitanus TaxID=2943436 RepID=UPI00244616A4|nr:defensin-like [Paramacrobiotus metropolitanus]
MARLTFILLLALTISCCFASPLLHEWDGEGTDGTDWEDESHEAVMAPLMRAKRDVLKGSCVWGATDYKSDCLAECKRMGYKGGHCGSFLNVNCWCEQ